MAQVIAWYVVVVFECAVEACVEGLAHLCRERGGGSSVGEVVDYFEILCRSAIAAVALRPLWPGFTLRTPVTLEAVTHMECLCLAVSECGGYDVGASALGACGGLLQGVEVLTDGGFHGCGELLECGLPALFG